jgi:hypothetical protein
VGTWPRASGLQQFRHAVFDAVGSTSRSGLEAKSPVIPKVTLPLSQLVHHGVRAQHQQLARPCSIRITANRGGRSLRLEVDGDIPVEAVTDFLLAAFRDTATQTAPDQSR